MVFKVDQSQKVGFLPVPARNGGDLDPGEGAHAWPKIFN